MRAGENALSQMRLVLNFSYGQRNPAVIAKCWLFIAMSLMQQVHEYFQYTEWIMDNGFRIDF